MTDTAILGAGMSRFGNFPSRALTDLGSEAVLGALADAGVERRQIDAAYVGTQWGGSMIGQRILRNVGLPRIPVANFENACSSGSTALHFAISDVRSGKREMVLVVGADKMSHLSGALPRHADDFDGGLGLSPPALYAMRAGRYIHDYDCRIEDIALVAVKNRRHATHNAHALFQKEVSVAEVQASRPVASPLTLLHCCARSDGAAAVIVTSAKRCREMGARGIGILASDLCSGEFRPGFRDMTKPEITVRGAKQAYEQAGIGPRDIDFAEVHDAFTIAEVLYYEALGFCGGGEGVRLLADGETTIGGRIPVNVSGGLMAKGHPPGATGVAQVVEAVQQLRGRAGARQVTGAQTALTHCTGGGVSGLDHGACTIHILAA